LTIRLGIGSRCHLASEKVPRHRQTSDNPAQYMVVLHNAGAPDYLLGSRSAETHGMHVGSVRAASSRLDTGINTLHGVRTGAGLPVNGITTKRESRPCR